MLERVRNATMVCSWIEYVLICIGASWFARFPPSALSSLARVHVGTGGGLDDGGDLEDEEVEDGHAEAAVTAARHVLPKKADRESSTTSTTVANSPCEERNHRCS